MATQEKALYQMYANKSFLYFPKKSFKKMGQKKSLKIP